MRPIGSSRQRWAAGALAGCLLAAGCEPAPSAPPATVHLAPSGIASTETPPTARASLPPIAPIPFADDLRDALDVDGIVADLGRLQSIADDHAGTRAAGSDGYDAAADFVANQLRDAGYTVQHQPVDVPFFRQTAPSTLAIVGAGARTFDDLHDFKAMLFSPTSEVTAPIFPLGFDPQATPEDARGLGCNPEDWQDVPAGVVVLVQPGTCRRHDVVVQAQLAGVVGLITSYPAWSRDAVLRPTLIEPSDIRIPVIGTTQDVGVALAQAAAAGAKAHISVHTAIETRSSTNVLAETPWGDTDHVVMVGGHLDSVIDGPGINDDGSGSMTVLAIARALAAQTGLAGGRSEAGSTVAPAGAWKVRFAFWTGEEIGLVGSTAWVGRGNAPPLSSIAVYINLDMLGSQNGGRYVYDGAATTRPVQSGAVQQLFVRALEDKRLLWQSLQVGSSDNVPFDGFGVATGGLFSGANEIKTPSQADLFGGTANVAEDACFHLACDRLDVIDKSLLGELAAAAGWVVGALASGKVVLGGT
jgi:hypothetical protein